MGATSVPMEPRAATRTNGTIEFGAAPPGALTWNPTRLDSVPEDRIVRGAFQHLIHAGLKPAGARDLGRAMGASARGGQLRDYLDGFSHLGIGRLAIEKADTDRFVVRGHDLDGSHASGAPACALALGFIEGAAAALTGHHSLGAEITCRSRGDETCTFFVRAKK